MMIGLSLKPRVKSRVNWRQNPCSLTTCTVHDSPPINRYVRVIMRARDSHCVAGHYDVFCLLGIVQVHFWLATHHILRTAGWINELGTPRQEQSQCLQVIHSHAATSVPHSWHHLPVTGQLSSQQRRWCRDHGRVLRSDGVLLSVVGVLVALPSR